MAKGTVEKYVSISLSCKLACFQRKQGVQTSKIMDKMKFMLSVPAKPNFSTSSWFPSYFLLLSFQLFIDPSRNSSRLFETGKRPATSVIYCWPI
jgi:hypothetical protein